MKYLQDRRPWQCRVNERSLYRRRLGLLQDAFKELKSRGENKQVLPHPADLSRTPEIRTIVELIVDGDTSLSVSVFSRLLPRLVEDWRKAREKELIAMSPFLPDTRRDADSPAASRPTERRSELSSPLHLACATYYCSSCHLPLLPSGALVHPCCYQLDTTWEGTVNDKQWLDGVLPIIEGDVYENACLVHFEGRLPWTSRPLRTLDVIMSKIIKACGEDPSKVTIAHMDKLNIQIACSNCAIEGRSALVMGWRAAVSVRSVQSRST